ncbi:MAG: copper amine oxidase [Acidobacteria bacterium]|nr:MAG: copper amine oxidase [Acidobacteriota bacterium]
MIQERARLLVSSILLTGLVAITGCTRSSEPPADPGNVVAVYKKASCGCCTAWVKYLRQAGFSVDVHELGDLGLSKKRFGIPAAMGSCHTAEAGGYFVEGHVPADDIKRLLRERPDAKGLTVPGMPAGSPGMEVPSGKIEPYDVLLVSKDGTTSVYAHHGG